MKEGKRGKRAKQRAGTRGRRAVKVIGSVWDVAAGADTGEKHIEEGAGKEAQGRPGAARWLPQGTSRRDRALAAALSRRLTASRRRKPTFSPRDSPRAGSSARPPLARSPTSCSLHRSKTSQLEAALGFRPAGS
eukprot:704076-Rhodomonas_salina.1